MHTLQPPRSRPIADTHSNVICLDSPCVRFEDDLSVFGEHGKPVCVEVRDSISRLQGRCDHAWGSLSGNVDGSSGRCRGRGGDEDEGRRGLGTVRGDFLKLFPPL